jgi:hypothetical protein
MGQFLKNPPLCKIMEWNTTQVFLIFNHWLLIKIQAWIMCDFDAQKPCIDWWWWKICVSCISSFMFQNNTKYANAEFWSLFECKNTQFVNVVQMVGDIDET